MKLLSVFFLIISTSACMAQPSNVNHSTDELDCTAISISPQLDDCVHKQMLSSNARLLAEIESFEKRAKQVYAPDPAIGKELIDKVLNAQSAWVSFREKNCSVEAFEIQMGTPAYNTTVNNCIILMNAKRIKVFIKLLQ
jgi:uncharacterized protein YecT (DUF1311 family)